MNIDSLGAPSPLLLDELLAPAHHVIENYTRCGRECPGIGDRDFVRLGFQRTLEQARSGRDFLQRQQECFDTDIARGSFFDSLHSPRRLRFLDEVAWQLYVRARTSLRTREEDLLAAFPELAQRAVWAVDGHKIEHACHALRDAKERHVAPNTLYLLCLHSGLLFNLAPVQGDGRYRHEMPVFREALPRFLRRELSARPRSRASRPLLVVDPAFIDCRFWERQRLLRSSGALMITRAKDNVAPRTQEERPFDGEDPVNAGVDTDWLCTFKGGCPMRLIHYADPETGSCYQFLTTDMELAPGLIAWLYFLRWRIEKVFDTAKNKLQETKAWATGRVARRIQAHFLALTHNLLVLFRGLLRSEFGLREEKLVRKRERQLERRDERASREGRVLHPLHFQMAKIVQLSVQFIRTLRNQILAKASLRQALPWLRQRFLVYL